MGVVLEVAGAALAVFAGVVAVLQLVEPTYVRRVPARRTGVIAGAGVALAVLGALIQQT